MIPLACPIQFHLKLFCVMMRAREYRRRWSRSKHKHWYSWGNISQRTLIRFGRNLFIRQPCMSTNPQYKTYIGVHCLVVFPRIPSKLPPPPFVVVPCGVNLSLMKLCFVCWRHITYGNVTTQSCRWVEQNGVRSAAVFVPVRGFRWLYAR